MDRLISEKEVLEVVDKACVGSIEYRVIHDRCEELIKAIPSAEPYKGMTNGEVIKAVFPNFHTEEMSHTVWVGYDAMSFHRDWWNSPYEPQERSDKE